MVKKMMYKGNEIPGYYIFDNGKIWSTKSKKHKFLKIKVGKDGYSKANIVLSKNNQIQISIHVLLAYTFLGMPHHSTEWQCQPTTSLLFVYIMVFFLYISTFLF